MSENLSIKYSKLHFCSTRTNTQFLSSLFIFSSVNDIFLLVLCKILGINSARRAHSKTVQIVPVWAIIIRRGVRIGRNCACLIRMTRCTQLGFSLWFTVTALRHFGLLSLMHGGEYTMFPSAWTQTYSGGGLENMRWWWLGLLQKLWLGVDIFLRSIPNHVLTPQNILNFLVLVI